MTVDPDTIKRNAKGQLTAKPVGSGRPLGVKNKAPAKIREMVAQALDKAGGVKYLVKQAHKEPRAFLSLVKAIIPKQLEAELGSSLEALLAASFTTKKVGPGLFERVEAGEPVGDDRVIDIPSREVAPSCPTYSIPPKGSQPPGAGQS